ncbi:MAG TPA: hypothetical protein PK067_01860 [Kaistella chaponensis]|nr:hypothetical protein [Kaistella chaponensis]
MKKLILAFSLLFAAQLSFAQAWQGKGDQKIQVGLSGLGDGTGIVGTYDYGLSKIISIGAGANFFVGEKKHDDADFAIFGRVNFHLQDPLGLPSQWDIYPGLDVGLLGKDRTYFGAHVGVRYFFNNNVGVYLEAGNNGSLGVSFNL